MTRPWAAGAVTGVGSLPGVDPVEAARLVFGELPGLPHLPELPARGAGADTIGRTAALLVDLPVEIVPSGWRFTAHPGADLRRARDFLAWDLDALEAAAEAFVGPVKVQVAGPWTLAASLELASGHRVVSDPGAVRDLAESLAEGVARHLAELGRRVPGARPVLQVDEPSVRAVLAGAVPTPSGYGMVRAVEASVVEQALARVFDVAPEGGRVVHCCAADPPFELFGSAGADAFSFDLAQLGTAGYDVLAAAVDVGTSLWPGVLPASDAPLAFQTARTRIRDLWTALGFPVSGLAAGIVATPSCGLAGASAEHARAVLTALGELGKWLADASGASES